ncbi:hypothetical protein DWG20_11990 [Crenobacter cavernae]|uniref:Uncharacterized protein n=1 Tax=Crenobacter cavernae TaxID=2290923 RepID=A0A345Y854_9NEIS|nr:hypothetical protein DWG20_11990 [Crenobacter cavernae]
MVKMAAMVAMVSREALVPKDHGVEMQRIQIGLSQAANTAAATVAEDIQVVRVATEATRDTADKEANYSSIT